VAAALLLTGAEAWSGDEDGAQVPQPVDACLSCHAIGPNEPVLKGPTLWQVVVRPIASVEGFTYSAALHRKQGVWDRATRDRWLCPSIRRPDGSCIESAPASGCSSMVEL
jgi:cytochrome c